MNLVNYTICKKETPLPPITAVFYEYITAANGVFVRAENEAFFVQFPVITQQHGQALQGLAALSPIIRWKIPKPPMALLCHLLADARQRRNSSGQPIEHLYHLRWHRQTARYEWHQPAQRSGTTFARSEHTETPAGYITVADFHSHGSLTAYFSEQDNADEKRFRFYGVVGKVERHAPQIVVRAGVYGHWHNIPYGQFFSKSTSVNFTK